MLATGLAAAIPLSNSLVDLAPLPDSWLYPRLDLQIHQRCFPLSVPGSPGDLKSALTTAEAQRKFLIEIVQRAGSLILFF